MAESEPKMVFNRCRHSSETDFQLPGNPVLLIFLRPITDIGCVLMNMELSKQWSYGRMK